MRPNRFTEGQVIGILSEAGAATKDRSRHHGANYHTVHRWTKTYGGLDVSDARRLKQL